MTNGPVEAYLSLEGRSGITEAEEPFGVRKLLVSLRPHGTGAGRQLAPSDAPVGRRRRPKLRLRHSTGNQPVA